MSSNYFSFNYFPQFKKMQININKIIYFYFINMHVQNRHFPNLFNKQYSRTAMH